MPIAAIAAVVSAAASISSARQQSKAQKQAADLARRQAKVQNEANVQAATTAREREQVASEAEANQAAATEQLSEQVDVTATATDPTDNPAARRRQTRSTFRMDGGSDGSGSLRV